MTTSNLNPFTNLNLPQRGRDFRHAMNNVKSHAEFISASPDPETSSIASLHLSFASFSLYQDKENEGLLRNLFLCSLS